MLFKKQLLRTFLRGSGPEQKKKHPNPKFLPIFGKEHNINRIGNGKRIY